MVYITTGKYVLQLYSRLNLRHFRLFDKLLADEIMHMFTTYQ